MTTKERIENCIKEIIFEDIKEEKTLGHHGIDSLDFVEIIMEIEKEFHIAIYNNDIFDNKGNRKAYENMGKFIEEIEKLVEVKTKKE